MPTIETERLLIRPAIEPDRPRLIELFGDPAFMEFSSVGAHSLASANRRFDQMVSLAVRVRYAKQPVLERDSHRIVGYTGVGIVDFEGRRRLEWGWRFDALARGKGYATEATNALLAEAGKGTDGEVLCIIAQDNEASKRVAEKVGFTCWRAFDFPDDPTTYDLFVRSIGAGGAPMVDTAGGAHPDGAWHRLGSRVAERAPPDDHQAMHWVRWAGKRVGQLAIAIVAGTFLVVFAVTFSTFENKRGRSVLERLWTATSESIDTYIEWWRSLISGDLGFSRSAGATVHELLLSKAPISLELVGISTALAVLTGIPAGILATQSRFRRIAVAASSVVMAIPPMVAAPLIITWVALGLGILPPNGWVRLSDSVGQNLEHLVLPIICLAGPFAAGVTLVTIAAVESHLGSDLEITAMSKGLPRRTILWRHILPLSLPTILADVGSTFTVMIGGTVIVESIFGIGGMGPELVDASTNRDLNLLAVLVLYAILLNWIVVTLINFLEHRLDPRIAF